jgi:hypothetical protein
MAAVLKQQREKKGEKLGENAVILEITENDFGGFLRTCTIRQLLILGECALGLHEDDLEPELDGEKMKKTPSSNATGGQSVGNYNNVTQNAVARQAVEGILDGGVAPQPSVNGCSLCAEPSRPVATSHFRFSPPPPIPAQGEPPVLAAVRPCLEAVTRAQHAARH